MKMISPQIQYSTRQSYRDYEQSYGRKSRRLYAYYKTYRELKKDIANKLKEAYSPEDGEPTVFVVRSKWYSGWGYSEYCETWAMRNGKPAIISGSFS